MDWYHIIFSAPNFEDMENLSNWVKTNQIETKKGSHYQLQRFFIRTNKNDLDDIYQLLKEYICLVFYLDINQLLILKLSFYVVDIKKVDRFYL